MNQVSTIVAATVPATVPASTLAADTGSALKYVLMNRPGAGNQTGPLAAHTCAVFTALGLFSGSGVSRETLLRVWGQTAVKYHATKFTSHGGLMFLNDDAAPLFERNIDPDLVDMFFEIITTGKSTRENTPRAYLAVKPL